MRFIIDLGSFGVEIGFPSDCDLFIDSDQV